MVKGGRERAVIRSKHPGEGGFWDCKASISCPGQSVHVCSICGSLNTTCFHILLYVYFTGLRFYLKRKEVLVWPLGRLWALMHWQNYFI